MKVSGLERKSSNLPTASFVSAESFELEESKELSQEFLKEFALKEIEYYQNLLTTLDSSDDIEPIKKYVTELKVKYFDENLENHDNYDEENLQVIYNNSYSELQEILNLKNDLPNLDLERIYKKMYIKYKNAMERKENRSPLTFSSFVRHYFGENFYEDTKKIFGNDEKGYLLGILENQIFIPMHFAPASLRLGASLINDLNVRNIPTCFFIPEDLRDTIIKLPGWRTLNYPIPMNFRGKISIKYPVFNSLRAVLGIVKKEYSKFKDKNEFNFKFKNYLNKLSQIFVKDSTNTNEDILGEILKEFEAKRGF